MIKNYEKQKEIVENEKLYRKDESLNFSALKDFDEQGAFEFYKRYVAKERLPFKESDAMDLGSLVDCLLTVPDTFDDKFFVISSDNSITGQSKELVDEMFRIAKRYYNYETDEVQLQFKELFITAFENVQINKSTGEQVKFKGKNWEQVMSIFTEGPMSNYYDSLLENINRRGVTMSNVDMARAIITNLLSVPKINEIFNPINSDIEVFPQYPLYFEYKSFKMKGLLDVLHVNHVDKVVQEFDLKTSWTVLDFTYNRFKNRYYLQEAVYNKGLELTFPGYKVLPRKYIIADSRNHIRPFIASTTTEHLEQGYKGFVTPSQVRRKGIDELIDDLRWHFDTSVWNTVREIYENNDEITLNIFGE